MRHNRKCVFMCFKKEFYNYVYRAIIAVEQAECDLLGLENDLRVGNGLPEESEAYSIVCDALNKIRNISFDKYFNEDFCIENFVNKEKIEK